MADLFPTRSPSVLCVDDNENGLRIRKEMLELFGFSIELATSGAAALELVEHHDFDAAIIDYRMPEMDGAELSERIKSGHPDTAVIMLTGYPHDIPPRTLKIVDALVVKGDRPEKLLNTLFRLTGAERRHLSLDKKEMYRRNTDHVHSVKKFLQNDVHRKH